MAMIKGKDGVTIDNVVLTHAKTLKCEKCEFNKTEWCP